MDKMEVMPNIFMKDNIFRRLSEVAKVGSLNEKERKTYDASLKQYRDGYAITQTGLIEAKAEGRAEGEAGSYN